MEEDNKPDYIGNIYPFFEFYLDETICGLKPKLTEPLHSIDIIIKKKIPIYEINKYPKLTKPLRDYENGIYDMFFNKLNEDNSIINGKVNIIKEPINNLSEGIKDIFKKRKREVISEWTFEGTLIYGETKEDIHIFLGEKDLKKSYRRIINLGKSKEIKMDFEEINPENRYLKGILEIVSKNQKNYVEDDIIHTSYIINLRENR